MRTFLAILLGLCAVPVAAQTLSVRPPSAPDPHRVAAETCVWDDVQKQLAAGASHDDIDGSLAIGWSAVEVCEDLIADWAAGSRVVREGVDTADEVAGRMRVHFAARGALFAEGKAVPFYREPAAQAAAASAPRVVPMPETCETRLERYRTRRAELEKTLIEDRTRLENSGGLEGQEELMDLMTEYEGARNMVQVLEQRCGTNG